MPKLSAEIKGQISTLQKKELEQIVVKLASRDTKIRDFLLVNYLEKETGKLELFEDTKMNLSLLFGKSYRGYSPELKLANMLSECTKEVNSFSKNCPDKKLEADLLMYVLEFIFSSPPNLFGTCFTAFDLKVTQMVKRLVTLVETKLHADLKTDYVPKINHYIITLRNTSSHNNFVSTLPQTL